MILLIDAGNTRIKWRVVVVAAAEPLRALDEGALAHDGVAALAAVRSRHPGDRKSVV